MLIQPLLECPRVLHGRRIDTTAQALVTGDSDRHTLLDIDSCKIRTMLSSWRSFDACLTRRDQHPQGNRQETEFPNFGPRNNSGWEKARQF